MINGNVNAHTCGPSPPRPHASITVGRSVHESWNKPAGFLRHVGRGACAVCETVRPHVGCPPAVSGCHSGACGGTAMRPHATRRPWLTSNTSRTSPSSPSRFHLLTPAVTVTTHFAFQTIGGEDEGRRRRRRRKNRRCSRPSVVLAGTERLRRSACGLKVMLATTLAIPSCIFPPSLPVRFLDRDS